MTLALTSPYGSSNGNFAFVGGAQWDPLTSVNVKLGISVRSGLLVKAAPIGNGIRHQGAAVSTAFAQSNQGQNFYWEITWSHPDLGMVGGVGVGTLPAGKGDALGAAFQDMADTAQAGLIVRPDGTVWVSGFPANPLVPDFQFIPPQEDGDTVGILLLDQGSGEWAIKVVGIIGGVFNASQSFFIPAAPVVPLVAYGSESAKNIVATANFGFSGANSFLGLQLDNIGFFALADADFGPITFGWPNRL